MKTLLAVFTVIFICFAAFCALGYANLEKNNARAEEAIYTYDFDRANKIYAELEHRFRYLAYAPEPLRNYYNQFSAKRAEISYLKEEYRALAGEEGELVANEENSSILFTRTNAFYRIIERGSPNKEIAKDRIGKLAEQYERVIRADNKNTDAAFDYEYLQRIKQNLQRKQNSKDGKGDNDKGQQKQNNGSEQQLLGKEGQKVADNNRGNKFNIYIPKADSGKTPPDKKEEEGIGKGSGKKKKG